MNQDKFTCESPSLLALPKIGSADNHMLPPLFDIDLQTRRRGGAKKLQVDGKVNRSLRKDSLLQGTQSSKFMKIRSGEQKSPFKLDLKLVKANNIRSGLLQEVLDRKRSRSQAKPLEVSNSVKNEEVLCKNSLFGTTPNTSVGLDDSQSEIPLAARRRSQPLKIQLDKSSSACKLNLKKYRLNCKLGISLDLGDKKFRSPNLKSTKKMPLPLYPKNNKLGTSHVITPQKVMSCDDSHSPTVPLNPCASQFGQNTANNDTENAEKRPKRSSQDKRKRFVMLCKGTPEPEQDGSLPRRKIMRKKISSVNTYLPKPDDPNFSGKAQKSSKLPEIKSQEVSLISKMKQRSRINSGDESGQAKIQPFTGSPVKFCQNERYPKFKFSMSTKCSSQKGVQSVKNIPKPLNGSEEKKQGVDLDNALIAVTEEDDTFCLNESLGSIISKDSDEALSVSISEDSMLSEIACKSKKKPKVIKFKKKESKAC